MRTILGANGDSDFLAGSHARYLHNERYAVNPSALARAIADQVANQEAERAAIRGGPSRRRSASSRKGRRACGTDGCAYRYADRHPKAARLPRTRSAADQNLVGTAPLLFHTRTTCRVLSMCHVAGAHRFDGLINLPVPHVFDDWG